MNSLVQAMVWTTLIALLAVLWMHARDTSGTRGLALSFAFHQVIEQIQIVWVALAVGFLISSFLFMVPTLRQSAIAASTDCGTGVSRLAPYHVESPVASICGIIQAKPDDLLGTWQVGSRTFQVDSQTDLRSPKAELVPGARARAELVRVDSSHWRARNLELMPTSTPTPPAN